MLNLNLSYPGPMIITGANGGIGSQFLGFLLKNNFKNIICPYNSSSSELTNIFNAHGLPFEKHVFKADLSNETDVQRFSDFTISNWGTPWAIANIAGGSTNAISWKITLEHFKKVIDMNLTTTFLMWKHFSPLMLKNNGGRVLNISSITAQSGIVGAAHYCAAKSAIEGLTRALATESSAKGVLVNTIALGYFEYGLINTVPAHVVENIKKEIPVQRLGKITDVAPMMCYLLSQNNEFITGQTIQVNGGQQF